MSLVPEQENDLIRARMAKLQEMREQGMDPFAVERYERTHLAKDIISDFDQLENQTVKAAGRVTAIREMGKASFAHIEDRSGKIQLYFRRDELADEYRNVHLMDLGDFIGVEGFVFRTRTGEISIHVQNVMMLSKALRPPPYGKQKGEEQWYGLQDVEQRYRQRYLDLIVNPESKDAFEKRSKIITAIRSFYDSRDYLEVETPVLQSVAGGAAARPFLTYHNALEHQFHLRISLELYLKRLVVGGFERVYEIGRVFRNEGLSTRHNPEFTLLESYEAYANLEDMMKLVEDMFAEICQKLYGGTKFMYQGQEIDVTPPWTRLPMLEGIEKYAGVKPEEFATLESAKAAMERVGLPTEHEDLVGGIIEKIHERFVQPNLIQPTFITDFPAETSPLAKKVPGNPNLTRRFEVYIGAQETGNAFSEINDPIDQKERFIKQSERRAAGDVEAHPMDEDFIQALEYGMPPTGGLGIGIDRLIILFTDQEAIRDVILFPQMKPEKAE
ncbi:MAG: lysine--tRNA ligase [Armatimonadota bacterium]